MFHLGSVSVNVSIWPHNIFLKYCVHFIQQDRTFRKHLVAVADYVDMTCFIKMYLKFIVVRYIAIVPKFHKMICFSRT